MKRKKPRLYWASFNYLELQLPADVVTSCSHSGQCDADVSAALQLPIIADQLAKIAPETLAKELQQYGAWSAEDLQDHEQNKARIVWIAANNISEEHKDFQAR